MERNPRRRAQSRQRRARQRRARQRPTRSPPQPARLRLHRPAARTRDCPLPNAPPARQTALPGRDRQQRRNRVPICSPAHRNPPQTWSPRTWLLRLQSPQCPQYRRRWRRSLPRPLLSRARSRNRNRMRMAHRPPLARPPLRGRPPNLAVPRNLSSSRQRRLHRTAPPRSSRRLRWPPSSRPCRPGSSRPPRRLLSCQPH